MSSAPSPAAPTRRPTAWLDLISSLSWDAIYFPGDRRYPIFTPDGEQDDYFWTGDGPRALAWPAGTTQTLRVGVVGGGVVGPVAVSVDPQWDAPARSHWTVLRPGATVATAYLTVPIAVPADTPPGSYSVRITARTTGPRVELTESIRVVGGTVPVDLSTRLDADVVSADADPADGNLGANFTFAAEELPAAGPIRLAGVPFSFPDTTRAGADNAVRAAGQTIAVPTGHYGAVYVLGFSVDGGDTGPVSLGYSDGSTGTASLRLSDWTSQLALAPGNEVAVLTTHAHLAGVGDTYLPGGVFEIAPRILATALPADPERELVSIRLPDQPTIFLFAMTLGRR